MSFSQERLDELVRAFSAAYQAFYCLPVGSAKRSQRVDVERVGAELLAYAIEHRAHCPTEVVELLDASIELDHAFDRHLEASLALAKPKSDINKLTVK